MVYSTLKEQPGKHIGLDELQEKHTSLIYFQKHSLDCGVQTELVRIIEENCVFAISSWKVGSALVLE